LPTASTIATYSAALELAKIKQTRARVAAEYVAIVEAVGNRHDKIRRQEKSNNKAELE
jgi:hypothetical protein